MEIPYSKFGSEHQLIQFFRMQNDDPTIFLTFSMNKKEDYFKTGVLMLPNGR
jgi:hypothetical protein